MGASVGAGTGASVGAGVGACAGARAGALARGHSAAVRACLRLSLAIDARLGGTEEHSPGLIERAAFTLLLMSVELTLSVATLGRSKQPVPILE